jgi:hypothetical protein
MYKTVIKLSEQGREIISNKEEIELKRSGNSDMLRVPSSWRRSFPQLQGANIIFEAQVERDADGRIYLVFQKERPTAEVKK